MQTPDIYSRRKPAGQATTPSAPTKSDGWWKFEEDSDDSPSISPKSPTYNTAASAGPLRDESLQWESCWRPSMEDDTDSAYTQDHLPPTGNWPFSPESEYNTTALGSRVLPSEARRDLEKPLPSLPTDIRPGGRLANGVELIDIKKAQANEAARRAAHLPARPVGPIKRGDTFKRIAIGFGKVASAKKSAPSKTKAPVEPQQARPRERQPARLVGNPNRMTTFGDYIHYSLPDDSPPSSSQPSHEPEFACSEHKQERECPYPEHQSGPICPCPEHRQKRAEQQEVPQMPFWSNEDDRGQLAHDIARDLREHDRLLEEQFTEIRGKVAPGVTAQHLDRREALSYQARFDTVTMASSDDPRVDSVMEEEGPDKAKALWARLEIAKMTGETLSPTNWTF